MGLYINRLDTVTITSERNLYIYLLDYGWPNGQWEQLFKKHFMKMADLAAETNSVVIASPRGIHFANEVLSYHRFGDFNVENYLPAILLTKTHPKYFEDHTHDFYGEAEAGLEDLLLVPLKDFCIDETGFIETMEGVFSDLKKVSALSDFQISNGDFRKRKPLTRLVESIELKPGIFGFRFDVKKYFSSKSK